MTADPTRTIPPDADALSAVIAAYLQAVDAGQTPDHAALLERHPYLADDLRAFFAAQDSVERIARPLRAAASGAATPPAVVDGRATGPAVGGAARPDPATGPGSVLGDYEVLGEIARGGMGVVYRARQKSANRVVALKMIRGGELADAAEVQRFRHEAGAVANLDHPHIVPIYEVCEYRGRPFFSMKLMEGTLAERLQTGRSPFSPAAAARLMAKVARAVHHAHQHGVLHRDLKPANILLDGHAEPHVTDFGLAKRLEDGPKGLTQSGAIVGTPEYMSPEQATAQKVLTTAVDVYGLGAVLYALLTGRPPFQGGNVLETLRQVVEAEPAPPWLVNRQVPRDLGLVCLRCLDKDPGRRYGSAEAVAEDLGRWLDGEPVAARPVGTPERVIKWVRRRPAVAGLLAAVLVVAAAGLGAFAWQYDDALRQKRIAEHEAGLALEQFGVANQRSVELADALRQLGEKNREVEKQAAAEAALREEAERRYQALRQTAAGARLVEATGLAASHPFKARKFLEDTDIFPLDLRDFAWAYQYAGVKHDPTVLGPRGGFTSWHGFSPDGRILGWFSQPGPVKLWDLDAGALRATLAHKGRDFQAVFSRDGKSLATAVYVALPGNDDLSRDGTEFKVWDLAAGRERWAVSGPRGRITALALSPNGGHLAAAISAGRGVPSEVRLWDTATGVGRVLSARAYEAEAVAFSHDGRWLALGGSAGRGAGRKEPGAGARVTPGGEIALWDLAAAADQPLLRWAAHQDRVAHLAFTADGRSLLSWDAHSFSKGDRVGEEFESTLKVWDLPGGREALSVPFNDRHGVALTGDGAICAVRHGDEVQIWDVSARRQKMSFKAAESRRGGIARSGAGHIALSGDGRTFFALTNQDVILFDATSGAERDRLPVRGPNNSPATGRLAVSADGSRLVLAAGQTGYADQGTLLVWDLAATDGRDLRQRAALDRQPAPDWPQTVALSPEGRLLAVAQGEYPPVMADAPDGALRPSEAVGTPRAPGAVAVLDGTTGRRRATLFRPGTATAIAFGPGGRLLAAACCRLGASGRVRGEVSVWDVATGREVRVLPAFDEAVCALAFSPDGRLLAAGGEAAFEIAENGPVARRGPVKFWDVATGQERGAFATANRVYALAFSPDGRTLAAGSARFQAAFPPNRDASYVPVQGEVTLWDVAAGREQAVLRKHRSGVRALAFSADGLTLATGSFDRTVLLWDVASGRNLRGLGELAGPVRAVAFAPDGQSLTAGTQDGTVTVWNVPTGQARLTLAPAAGVEPRALAFRADGLALDVAGAFAGPSPFVELRRLGAAAVPALLPESDRPLALSPDGSTLATANPSPGQYDDTPGILKLWDMSTGQARARLNGHTLPIMALAYTTDSKVVVSVANAKEWISPRPEAKSVRQPQAGEVRLWDVTRGQELATLPHLAGMVRAVAVQPGGRLITVATGVKDRNPLATEPWLSGAVQLFDGPTGREVRPLTGNLADVRAVAFSADGRQLSAYSCEGKEFRGRPARLQTWAAEDGRELSSVPVPASLPDRACFSADGRRLIVAACGQMTVWDVATGQEERILGGHPAPVTSLLLTADGRTAITSSLGGTTAWDVATLGQRYQVPGSRTVPSLTPDGRTVHLHRAAAQEYLDVASGRPVAAFSAHAYPSPQVSADGRLFVGVRSSTPSGRWETSTLEIIRRPETGTANAARPVLVGPAEWRNLLLTPDGGTMILNKAPDGDYELWDTATGRRRAQVPGSGRVTPRLSPDGKVLAVPEVRLHYAASGASLARVTLWDVTAGRPIATWENDESRGRMAATFAATIALGTAPYAPTWIPEICDTVSSQGLVQPTEFSPDGRTLLVFGPRATWLLEAATGRERAVWRDDTATGGLQAGAFSPDGRVVALDRYERDPATGGFVHRVNVREFPGGRLLGTLPPLPNSNTNMLFTPDNQTLIVNDASRYYDFSRGMPAEPWQNRRGIDVILWDVQARRVRSTISGAPGPISLSPDGRALLSQSLLFDAAGRKSGKLTWWDVATGHECGRLPEVTGQVVWAADGQSLFAPTPAGVLRLRSSDGMELARLDGAAAPLAVTPDGATLLAAVPEGVGVWDLNGGGRRGTLPQYADVRALGFHPDSPHLISVADGRPKFWNLDTGEGHVPPPDDPLSSRVQLDGRTQWSQDLSNLTYPVPTLPAGQVVLTNDRFRLVKEDRSFELWTNGPGGSPSSGPAKAATETARGLELLRKGQPAASDAFRKAAELDPGAAEPPLLLVDALERQGRRDEAVAALDKACQTDPRHAWMFLALAREALRDKSPDRALALFDRAVQYRPEDAAAQFERAEALALAGSPDAAAAGYRKAVALYPDHAEAWARLAVTLAASGHEEEARQARRRAADVSPALGDPAREKAAREVVDRARRTYRAIEIADGYAGYHLVEQGYPDEAVLYLSRAALAMPVGWPEISCYLGVALMRQGRYAEAVVPLRLGHRLGATQPGWSRPSAQWVREAERGLELEARLPKVLGGEAEAPDAAGLVELARFAAHQKHQFAAAARLTETALASHPEWADYRDDPPCYFAAAAAVRASSGAGDGAAMTGAELAQLRGRALAWLRQELARKAREWEEAPADAKDGVRRSLAFWQDDGWLSPVRDAGALNRLPADERQAWRALWADAEGLRWRPLDSRREALLRGETAGVKAVDLLQYALSRDRLGHSDEAITLTRHAAALDPKLADAHGNLSYLLHGQGKWAESAEEARKAIRINPKVGWYHNNLGWSLQNLGQLREAADAYRAALRIEPGNEKAHSNLERLQPVIALLPRLEAIRRGEAEPAGAEECLKLANVCQYAKLNATAARLYAEAFAVAPARADDLAASPRYNAACHAALAAAGEGLDARLLPDKVSHMLRRQALAWLRADLTAWRKHCAVGTPADREEAARLMRWWKEDADLASIREAPELAKLPPDQREAFLQLWADVTGLQERLAKKE
jgi:WD40 repeat protein/tetratricopeptide (TPR) repeat protein/tRNA A-37 threonylcarbamoyl transferase component Bud32